MHNEPLGRDSRDGILKIEVSGPNSGHPNDEAQLDIVGPYTSLCLLAL